MAGVDFEGATRTVCLASTRGAQPGHYVVVRRPRHLERRRGGGGAILALFEELVRHAEAP